MQHFFKYLKSKTKLKIFEMKLRSLVVLAAFMVVMQFSHEGNTLYLNRTILLEIYPNLSILNRLDLQNRQIESIDQASFNGLVTVEQLWLGYNQLTSIHPATFEGLIMLEKLGLRS